jgi:hypothetical protein
MKIERVLGLYFLTIGRFEFFVGRMYDFYPHWSIELDLACSMPHLYAHMYAHTPLFEFGFEIV